MPNCAWYAAGDDHRAVVDAAFALGGVEVWDLVSPDGQPLRRYDDTDAVIARLALTGSAHFCLRVVAAGPPVLIERTERAVDGTFFERAWGAGMIQFYLTDLRPALPQGNMGDCTTNHLTAKGAVGRSAHPFFQPQDWDFDAVTQFSSRLNRRIRALGVAKWGGRVLLPQAHGLWRNGQVLQGLGINEIASRG